MTHAPGIECPGPPGPPAVLIRGRREFWVRPALPAPASAIAEWIFSSLKSQPHFKFLATKCHGISGHHTRPKNIFGKL